MFEDSVVFLNIFSLRMIFTAFEVVYYVFYILGKLSQHSPKIFNIVMIELIFAN